MSAVTIRGGSLFHTSITRIAKNCARIFTLESGQYSLRECHLVQPPDSVKNSQRVILAIPFIILKQVVRFQI